MTTTAMQPAPIGGATLRKAVAEEVRVWLARRRISGAELARRLGRSQTFVAKRLDGRQAFDVDDLEMIAVVLGVNPRELLAGLVAAATQDRGGRPAPPEIMRGNIGARSRGERAVIIPFPQVGDVRPDGRARAGTNGPGSSLVTTRDVAA